MIQGHSLFEPTIMEAACVLEESSIGKHHSILDHLVITDLPFLFPRDRSGLREKKHNRDLALQSEIHKMSFMLLEIKFGIISQNQVKMLDAYNGGESDLVNFIHTELMLILLILMLVI